MKIDLHIHTSERSDCGRSNEAEQITAAKAAGLDGIVFTDHEKLVPEGRLEGLNREHAPLMIFSGIEISLDGEDVVVLGIQDEKIEREDWEYGELWEFVRERGGFLFLAHPFRYHEGVEIDVGRYPVDAMEVNSSNMGRCNEKAVEAFAAAHGLGRLCNSDAHVSVLVGTYYNEIGRKMPRTDAGLVGVLRAGGVECRRDEGKIAALNAVGVRLR